MVLLTATLSMVEGLRRLDTPVEKPDAASDSREPSLDNVEVGKPISHGQVVAIWKGLRSQGLTEFSLEGLLRGAQVYIPPPPPKPEPSDEYKALMARLRRDEEERSYERMVRASRRPDTLSPTSATSSALARGFAEVNRPSRPADVGDDDVTYADVHRQLMLILNFLVSIAGVAATLWVVARWWSTPARLFLTLGGSIVVAIAEVAVYSGYIWRMGEAKGKQESVKEVKEVVQTWVVGSDGADGGKGKDAETVLVSAKDGAEETALRRRKKDPT